MTLPKGVPEELAATIVPQTNNPVPTLLIVSVGVWLPDRLGPSLRFVPFCCHWYVSSLPMAETEKVAGLPAQTTCETGCVRIIGSEPEHTVMALAGAQ